MRPADVAAMATPQNLDQNLDTVDLEHTTGGMKWEGRRESYNVEDRRPGAPPTWAQPVLTWWRNFRNGYLY